MLRLGRSAVPGGALPQASDDLIVKVTDNQLRHGAINDSTERDCLPYRFGDEQTLFDGERDLAIHGAPVAAGAGLERHDVLPRRQFRHIEIRPEPFTK